MPPVRLAHVGGDVGGRVVDRLVGAELAQTRALLGAARGGDHVGAAQLREQQRARADAAARAEDQDLLARTQPAAREEHAVRRAVGDGQAGGVLVADVVGQRDQLRVWTTQ